MMTLINVIVICSAFFFTFGIGYLWGEKCTIELLQPHLEKLTQRLEVLLEQANKPCDVCGDD